MENWSAMPDKLDLAHKEVHIWRIDLDLYFQINSQNLYLLSSDEIKRANRFYFEQDQRRFLAARLALRFLLGKYLGAEPKEIVFHYEVKGKPFVNHNLNLHFNLSHADRMALVAFALDTPIGADIEFIKKDIEFEAVAEHFFSVYEVKTLLNLPESKRAEAFFNAWTRKESFIKATGDGLSFPLAQFDVSLIPGEPARLLATHWKLEEAPYWSLCSFDPMPGFKGAFAWRETVRKVYFWDLLL